MHLLIQKSDQLVKTEVTKRKREQLHHSCQEDLHFKWTMRTLGAKYACNCKVSEINMY
jgi:hypothetical protein